MGYGLLIVQKASRNKRGQGEGVLLLVEVLEIGSLKSLHIFMIS